MTAITNSVFDNVRISGELAIRCIVPQNVAADTLVWVADPKTMQFSEVTDIDALKELARYTKFHGLSEKLV